MYFSRLYLGPRPYIFLFKCKFRFKYFINIYLFKYFTIFPIIITWAFHFEGKHHKLTHATYV